MKAPNSEVIAKIFRAQQAGPPDLKAFKRESADDAYGQFIPAHVALGVWQALRTEHKTLGYYPLLMETDSRFEPTVLNQRDVAETVELGRNLNATQWLTERWKEIGDDGLEEDCRGEMPKMRAARPLSNDRLYLLRSLDKKISKVFLALLPVAEPWIVPAYLSQGGWNDCPDATVQVCFHKHWYERCGAQPIVFGIDYLEFFVERPPQTAKEALALAEEQFAFCTDIVAQGTETIEKLAAELFQSPVWFFWWD